MLGNLNDPAMATALVMVAITLTFFLLIFGEEKMKFRQPRDQAVTAGMVFVMVALASIYFLIADQIMRLVVSFLLGVGG
jgi:preprotein translocase subunit SecE